MVVSKSVYAGVRTWNHFSAIVKRFHVSSGSRWPFAPTLTAGSLGSSQNMKAYREKPGRKGRMTSTYRTVPNVLPEFIQIEESNEEPSSELRASVELVLKTLPDISHESTAVDYPDHLTDFIVTPTTEKQIISADGFPQPIPRPLLVNSQEPYHIIQMLGRGLGVVATRDLKTGDLIISERPILVVPAIVLGAPVPIPSGLPDEELKKVIDHTLAAKWESSRLFQEALDRLQPEQKQAFMALHNVYKDDGGITAMLGKFKTNAFGIRFLGEGQYGIYASVMKDASRLNHSWDPASFSIQFHAARDIKAGEELTTHYCELTLSTKERKHALLAGYSFECTCPSCSFPDTTAIDKKRADAYEARCIDNDAFADWFLDLTEPDDKFITQGLAELAILRELELDVYMDGPLYRITQSYVVLGDEEGAAKYGAMLLAINRARYGKKVEDVHYTLDYFKSLPTWGLRVKNKENTMKADPLLTPIPWEVDEGGVGVFRPFGSGGPLDPLLDLLKMAVEAGNEDAARSIMYLMSGFQNRLGQRS